MEQSKETVMRMLKNNGRKCTITVKRKKIVCDQCGVGELGLGVWIPFDMIEKVESD
jgi:hypothetical protein